MLAERRVEHYPPCEVMYPDWDALTRGFDAPPPGLPVVPREQNAHLKSTERQRGRGVEQVAISPPLGKSCDKKRRNDPSRHMRKLVYQERVDCLANVLEGYFVAQGWSIIDAEQMARWWVCDKLASAQKFTARLGYGYRSQEWEGN